MTTKSHNVPVKRDQRQLANHFKRGDGHCSNARGPTGEKEERKSWSTKAVIPKCQCVSLDRYRRIQSHRLGLHPRRRPSDE